jgi:hypothetical protein
LTDFSMSTKFRRWTFSSCRAITSRFKLKINASLGSWNQFEMLFLIFINLVVFGEMCYHDDDRFVANVFGSGGVTERVESLGQIGSRRGHARHLYDNQFRYNFLYKIINSD